MDYYITVNEKAISVNSMYGRNGSKSFLSKEAIFLQEEIREALEEKYGAFKQIEGKVTVKLHIERKKRRWDLDNMFKCIIDGLVKAGVLVDDDQVFCIYAMKGEGFRDCIRVKVEEMPFQEIV